MFMLCVGIIQKTGSEADFKQHYTTFRKNVYEMTANENHEISEVARLVYVASLIIV